MSLTAWSINPSVAYVAVAALLYWLGGRDYHRRGGWRTTLAFYGGLLTIVLALDSPLDTYADRLFWVHMSQHILLLTVAPPLILLGRPWPRMWRALPLRTRTSVGRTLARAGWTAPLRAMAKPVPAFVLFNATVLAWHIPAAYNATLTSDRIHNLEHFTFFLFGMLFWARVVDPGPLRPRLIWPVRLGFVAGSMVISWLLAITLVLVHHPLYAHYAHLLHRPGGITAASDQQIAAGIMWVPGSVAYTITLLAGLYRWLAQDTTAGPRQAALTT